MYQAIEAEIENGRVKSPDLRKLPPVAHVLITWINSSADEKTPSKSGPTSTHSLRGALKMFSNPALIKKEKGAWAHTAERKHEAG